MVMILRHQWETSLPHWAGFAVTLPENWGPDDEAGLLDLLSLKTTSSVKYDDLDADRNSISWKPKCGGGWVINIDVTKMAASRKVELTISNLMTPASGLIGALTFEDSLHQVSVLSDRFDATEPVAEVEDDETTAIDESVPASSLCWLLLREALSDTECARSCPFLA